MVSHFARIAATSSPVYARISAPGLASPRSGFGGLRNAAPMTGAQVTATSQEATSEIATTAKIEKVYSLAELRANPTGTKPAMVISVPASIGAASVLYAKVAAASLESPAARRRIIASTVVIAS